MTYGLYHYKRLGEVAASIRGRIIFHWPRKVCAKMDQNATLFYFLGKNGPLVTLYVSMRSPLISRQFNCHSWVTTDKMSTKQLWKFLLRENFWFELCHLSKQKMHLFLTNSKPLFILSTLIKRLQQKRQKVINRINCKLCELCDFQTKTDWKR